MEKCFCGICGACCNTEDFKLIEDESGAMLVEVINNNEDSKIQELINNLDDTNLVEIISLNSLREDAGLIKVAAKHKPNNPSLWARCIAEAKKKFDVFPCVPIENSHILTSRGWKSCKDVSVGEKIVSYNMNTKFLEWDTVSVINLYSLSNTFRLFNENKSFDFISTGNHNWVSSDGFVRTKDIKEDTIIMVSAAMSPAYRQPISFKDFNDDGIHIVDKILAMSNEQRAGWLESSIINENNIEEDVSSALDVCKFLTKGNSYISGLKLIETKSYDVWCPTTSNGTWIMKQNNLITITGNSAYANGYAAKLYKKKGGTWKTVKEKKSKRK